MRRIVGSLLLITLFTFQLSAQCVSSTNNIVTFTYNQSFYEIVKENQRWTNANNCAKSRGGHLAIIDSLKEQDTIFSALNGAGIVNSNTLAPDGGNAAYVWIGGTDSATEGTWVWDTIGTNNPQFWIGARNGSPVGSRYNNWGNEPDNFQNQDGLGLALSSWPFGSAGEWNDVDLTNTLYYVIEYKIPVGIEKVGTDIKSSELNVYPNPASNWVKISCDCELNANASVFIFDINGAKVMETTLERGQNKLPIERLKSGVYWIQVEGVNNLFPLQKID